MEMRKAFATSEYAFPVIEEPQRIDLSLEPLDDYVVIQPSSEFSDEEAETKTPSGLIIPASAESVCLTGIVTAIGSDAGGIEPGDKVLFPKEAGFEVRLHGGEVKVLRRSELIARIND
jgi:chaperonin GroES